MPTPEIDTLTEKFKELAWEILVCSVFRQSEKTTLNLIITLVGISSEEEASELINHIFRLVRKGVIYVPEARLETFKEAPERVDVYMIRDFNETMRELGQKLKELRIEIDGQKELPRIPQKVLIDLKNYAEGKYIQKFH
ncbi:MAG: hypothetical protein ACFFAJ_13275 [Candidatus Hodarchaeota archaeon]